MKKLILNNKKTMFLNEPLFYSISKSIMEHVENVQEAQPGEKQSSFILTIDLMASNNKIDHITLINENEKITYYAQLLSYKLFKMYRYDIRIKRIPKSINKNDFVITLTHPDYHTKHIYYLFDIEL